MIICKMKRNFFKIAVRALILRRNKVLLLHRRDYDLWELPGGGMDNNETIEQALKREVKEETNLTIKPLRLVGVYHNYREKVIIFTLLIKVLSGRLKKNDEADDFKWCDYRKFPKNLSSKNKERIADYYKRKKHVIIRTQKQKRSIEELGLKKLK